jgi:hypothetical protein
MRSRASRLGFHAALTACIASVFFSVVQILQVVPGLPRPLVYVSLNYVVQLATVIPARVNDTLASIRVLDQTPHSLFWDVDALGYIFLGLSTLFAAFAIDAKERWLRRFLIANAAITPLVAFVYFYPRFSIALLFLGAPWLVTVPGALLLLTRHFRREAST